jgi:hypothetical protein
MGISNTWHYGLGARYLSLACLLISLASLTACSYLTNFVVVNASGRPIEVQYRVKNPGQPMPATQMLPITPATKPASQIEQQNPWRDLSTSEFKFEPNSRTVGVLLMPGEALRIEQRNLVDGPQDDASQAPNFAIEEISISGSSGVISLEGEQARKAFVHLSDKTSTLTYK